MPIERARESVSEAADFGYQGFDAAPALGADEMPTGSKFTLGIKFRVGSERDDQMMDVARRLTAATLGDVRGNRHGRFSQLIGQSGEFTRRKVLGQVVHHVR